MTRLTSNQSASASSCAATWFPCSAVDYEPLGSGTLAFLHHIIAVSVYRAATAAAAAAAAHRLTTGGPE